MSEAYMKTVTWEFVVSGETWRIAPAGDNTVYIEETRKNGQEDSHAMADLVRDDASSPWRYDGDVPFNLRENFYSDTPEKILRYVNDNPLPPEAFS